MVGVGGGGTGAVASGDLVAVECFIPWGTLGILGILVAFTGFEICFLFIIYVLVVFLVPQITVSASKFVK